MFNSQRCPINLFPSIPERYRCSAFEGKTKLWQYSFLSLWINPQRLLDTNEQTDTQFDKQRIYIDIKQKLRDKIMTTDFIDSNLYKGSIMWRNLLKQSRDLTTKRQSNRFMKGTVHLV